MAIDKEVGEVWSGDLLLYFLKALMHHINTDYCTKYHCISRVLHELQALE